MHILLESHRHVFLYSRLLEANIFLNQWMYIATQEISGKELVLENHSSSPSQTTTLGVEIRFGLFNLHHPRTNLFGKTNVKSKQDIKKHQIKTFKIYIAMRIGKPWCHQLVPSL